MSDDAVTPHGMTTAIDGGTGTRRTKGQRAAAKRMKVKARRTPDCHPDRRHHAKGLCKSCYYSPRVNATTLDANGKSVPVVMTPNPRLADPKVAEHIVAVILKHQLDFNKAVREMHPTLPPVNVAELAHKLEHSPHVQTALGSMLAQLSLDGESKEFYVRELWFRFRSSQDIRERIAAMKMLGKAFISERVEVSRPEELRIEGFEAGVEGMLTGGARRVLPEPVEPAEPVVVRDANEGEILDAVEVVEEAVDGAKRSAFVEEAIELPMALLRIPKEKMN